MVCYSKTDHWCGPSSGVSIGQYYRNRSASTYGSNYPNLPIGVDDYPDAYNDMYWRLHDYMDTAILGTTYPYNYGPGFVEMALHYGYDNFSYVYYAPESEAGPVTEAFYGVIKNAIDNGWPVALFSMGLLVGFEGVEEIWTDGSASLWPCEVWHVIAIKGYADGFMGHAHVIRCTDNYSHADNLYLDWDELWDEVGELGFLEAVIIKDEDDTPDGLAVEDFEWGSDGDSLNTWGGEVDWEVTIQGASVAEIDDDIWHSGTGTKSARFYRASSKIVYAYYSLLRPSYIGFWVMKDDTAYTTIANGDGSKYIWVRIDNAERIQYYGSSGYVTLPYTFPVGTWRHIEFKNINWDAGTYDIYINGSRKTYPSATMRSAVSYKDNLYFESRSGAGTFWIDDISDHLY
jgi:hypothetical protein